MSETNGQNSNIVKIIMQAGGIGIATISLWLVWSLSSDFNKTMNNHINGNTAALIELKSTIEQTNEINRTQVRAIEVQAKAIEGLTNAFINLRR